MASLVYQTKQDGSWYSTHLDLTDNEVQEQCLKQKRLGYAKHNTVKITDKDTIIKDCNELSPHYSWVSSDDEEFSGAAMIHSIVACNAHLLKALKTNRLPETTGEDNLRTMRLMFCAIDSADKDKLIYL